MLTFYSSLGVVSFFLKKLLADWKAGEYETPEVLTKLIGLVQVMEQFTKRNVQGIGRV